MNKDYNKLIKKDKYQVLIFTCPVPIPFNFAIHPWIICNEKGKVTRYEVVHFKKTDINIEEILQDKNTGLFNRIGYSIKSIKPNSSSISVIIKKDRACIQIQQQLNHEQNEQIYLLNR